MDVKAVFPNIEVLKEGHALGAREIFSESMNNEWLGVKTNKA